MYDIIVTFVLFGIAGFAAYAIGLKTGQKRRDETVINVDFRRAEEPPAPPPVQHIHVVKFADLAPIPVFRIAPRNEFNKSVTVAVQYTEDKEVARGYAESPLHSVTVIAGFKTPDGKLLKVNTSELLTTVSQ